jgi:SAM-dependent methyltransferase
MSTQDWNDKFDYLRRSHRLSLNDDYLQFLVERVWHLDQRCDVVDFGCGFGYWAGQLLPLLATGSTYTGIDIATDLLEKGRDIFSIAPYPTHFFEADSNQSPLSTASFDLSITRALLMHLEDPKKTLQEMVRLTRPGGLVVCLESNWDAVNALTYVEEMDKLETHDLGFLQTLFERNSRDTGRDGNIGRKIPALMHSIGLQDIGSRLSDCAHTLAPPFGDTTQEALYDSLVNDGWTRTIDKDEAERMQRRFEARGFSKAQALAQVDRERRFTDTFRTHGRQYHTLVSPAMMFSYGTVPNPKESQ